MTPPPHPRKGGRPAEPPSWELVMEELKRIAKPDGVLTMKRVGITGGQMWGISVPDLRRLGKLVGIDQHLARELWETGVHEARILATLVGDPAAMPARELDGWLRDLDSWDLTDAFTGNLVARSAHA